MRWSWQCELACVQCGSVCAPCLPISYPGESEAHYHLGHTVQRRLSGRRVCLHYRHTLLIVMMHTALQSFILEDLKANLDLAIAWLFAEYSLAEGLHGTWEENLRTYDQCLTGLLRGAKETLGPKDRSTHTHTHTHTHSHSHTPCHPLCMCAGCSLDWFWRPLE